MTNKEYTLVTTADVRTWPVSTPILFLGEWCKLPGKRNIWNAIDSLTAKPYGVDKEKVSADRKYLKKLESKLLEELVVFLNQFHNTNHNTRYWHIVIGPWLRVFTEILLNRWNTIHAAIKDHNVKTTYIFRYAQEDMVPNDMQGFIYMYFTDEWNHVIYSKILNEYTNIKCFTIEDGIFFRKENNLVVKASPLGQKLKKMLHGINSLYVKYFIGHNHNFMYDTQLNWKMEVLVNLVLGQLPVRWTKIECCHQSVDMQLRGKLEISHKKYESFDKFVRESIIDNIPVLYLEGYKKINDMVDKLNWPKKPKFIWTSNAHFSDDLFKIWAAEKVEKSIPYIISQHGGNYGTVKHVPNSDIEYFEKTVSDRYLTWGWKEDSENFRDVYPLGIITRIGNSKETWNKSGGLLLMQLHRDLRDTAWDETSLYKDYLSKQLEFVGNLSKEIREKCTVRLHPNFQILGWKEDEIWRQHFPKIKIDKGIRKLNKELKKNRLIVHTYNSTGILETMAVNIPTIFFWDPSFWEIRDRALPFYDELKSVGIYHNTPESAVALIQKIWSDVSGWWNDSDVQDVRKKFCSEFACIPLNPIAKIKDALTFNADNPI